MHIILLIQPTHLASHRTLLHYLFLITALRALANQTAKYTTSNKRPELVDPLQYSSRREEVLIGGKSNPIGHGP